MHIVYTGWGYFPRGRLRLMNTQQQYTPLYKGVSLTPQKEELRLSASQEWSVPANATLHCPLSRLGVPHQDYRTPSPDTAD